MHDWPAWLKPATLIFDAAVFQSRARLDDHRRVVAELEPDPLARRPLADAPADGRRAREGDERDVGVVDERVADVAAAAGHDAEPSGRRPHSSSSSSASAIAGERRLAGGLQHDGTARRDRRRELVGDEVQREVERTDGADDADRDTQDEAELALADLAGVERNHLAGQRAGNGGGELERAHGAGRPRSGPS